MGKLYSIEQVVGVGYKHLSSTSISILSLPSSFAFITKKQFSANMLFDHKWVLHSFGPFRPSCSPMLHKLGYGCQVCDTRTIWWYIFPKVGSQYLILSSYFSSLEVLSVLQWLALVFALCALYVCFSIARLIILIKWNVFLAPV